MQKEQEAVALVRAWSSEGNKGIC